MSALRFGRPAFQDLRTALLADPGREACGIIYACDDANSGVWTVRRASVVPDDAYEHRDAISAILKAAYLVEVANYARANNLSVTLAHTHPFSDGKPDFSPIDDEGEIALAEYFNRRVSGHTHLALVVGRGACRARVLGSGAEIAVWEVGSDLVCISAEGLHDAQSAYDRQIRAFGAAGQRTIAALHVGIVGEGGTGSVVTQQLAHLGVQNFTLVDPDTVEQTNLNRLVGSSSKVLGTPKVLVAEHVIRSINPSARVTALRRDVVDADIAPHLAGLDFIFLCTDSHASRAIVSQIAYQYLVPVIDVGVSITAKLGNVSHITGRVQMLAPGLPCLTCCGALNGEQIRREMLTDEQRSADPYVIGAHEPQPAVVSLNSTMSSLAVTMFLGAVTPIPASARFQYYDGVRGTVRPTVATADPNCIICSENGALARGASWSLPGRPVTRG